MCFDLLAVDGVDLRSQPLATRRALLAEMLSGVGAPIALCQQTDDLAVALDWMQTLTAGGLEGVVAKDPAQTYPTKPGQRIWSKVKSRRTIDMLAVGLVGKASAPTSLVLAMPTDVDDPPTAGTTTVLTRAAARALAPLMHPTGVTWERRSNWASSDTVEVQQIESLVVEVSADTAVNDGILRHAVRLVRARPDLQVDDLLAD